VSRRIPEARLEQLVDAAARVFIEQGYARTQMAEVAAALGVAEGTIYLYVETALLPPRRMVAAPSLQGRRSVCPGPIPGLPRVSGTRRRDREERGTRIGRGSDRKGDVNFGA
jgi:hypothetical protein